MSVGDVCEAAQRSLFCTPSGLNELPEGDFKLFSFHIDRQIDNGFYIRPIMTLTQTLVHRWGAQNKVTDRLPDFSFVRGAGCVFIIFYGSKFVILSGTFLFKCFCFIAIFRGKNGVRWS